MSEYSGSGAVSCHAADVCHSGSGSGSARNQILVTLILIQGNQIDQIQALNSLKLTLKTPIKFHLSFGKQIWRKFVDANKIKAPRSASFLSYTYILYRYIGYI